MALKDVARKPSIRLLTKAASDEHISHKPTLLSIDWSNVTAEEYQMMAACWVATHWQQWAAKVAVGTFAQPIPEKAEVSVRWLLDHQQKHETRSEEIPDSWKGKVGIPSEDALATMTTQELQQLLAQLQQLTNNKG